MLNQFISFNKICRISLHEDSYTKVQTLAKTCATIAEILKIFRGLFLLAHRVSVVNGL